MKYTIRRTAPPADSAKAIQAQVQRVSDAKTPQARIAAKARLQRLQAQARTAPRRVVLAGASMEITAGVNQVDLPKPATQRELAAAAVDGLVLDPWKPCKIVYSAASGASAIRLELPGGARTFADGQSLETELDGEWSRRLDRLAGVAVESFSTPPATLETEGGDK